MLPNQLGGGFMAKRKRSTSIERKLKDGLGQGIGGYYKPWVKIQDVPSLGRTISHYIEKVLLD